MTEPNAPDQPPPQTEAAPKFRRRKEARPDELLDAALALFTEKGFDRTRVEDIARRAGVSKGAVYLYFPSKDAMIEALVDRAVGGVAQSVAARLNDFNGDPRVLLRSLLPMVAAKLADPKVIAVPRLVVQEAGGHPRLAAIYRARVIDHVLPAARGMFARAVEAGHIRAIDPDLALRLVMGPLALHAIMDQVFDIHASGGTDFAAVFDGLLDILDAGLDPALPPVGGATPRKES
ncbi:TetR/AcrR family transcriptional regulator [Celeribacter sp.]|uniref:TetR/AcrR family transcriptional regulator n=1 Tax=Celeribacter sp. TaxID=1890673 RepID=UPI003A8C95EA